MVITEKLAELAKPVYGRFARYESSGTSSRPSEEYATLWQKHYDQALGRVGEPNAARYAANRRLTEIEAEDNGHRVGSGDFEVYG